MHGISPINQSLTATQSQVSAQISQVLPELPTTVSDLISEMAVPDFSIATQEPEVNEQGEIIQNESNQRIIDHIEMALTSPSDQCHPATKAQIFVTGSEQQTSNRKIRPYLVQLLNGLRDNTRPVNLDDVELTGLDLENSHQPINLSGMSAQRASFTSINMRGTILSNVNLKGATFTDTNLCWVKLEHADIIDAVFSNVSFGTTDGSGLTGNQSGILTCINYDSFWILGKDIRTLHTVSWIFGDNVSASPDREAFTLITKTIHSNGVCKPEQI